MSQPREPDPVKLISSLFSPEKTLIDGVIQVLSNDYGPVDSISPELFFDRTKYYEREMGWPLHRRFVSFEKLILADDLVETKLKTAGDRIARLAGPELAHVDQKIAALRLDKARRPEFGYHSALARDMEQTKWVQIDLGKKVVVERINYVGCHDDFANIGAGFGFPQRFKIELADDAEFRTHVLTILDHTDSDVVNPGTAPQTVRAGGKAGRFIRWQVRNY